MPLEFALNVAVWPFLLITIISYARTVIQNLK